VDFVSNDQRAQLSADSQDQRMPITQIPFQDPVAPPEKPQAEQLGLYDSEDWENAERDLDARVPHLLIQLQDDLARSRKREAIWISVIVHLVLTIALWNFKLIERFMPFHGAVAVPLNLNKDKDVTFLALPPDAQKLTRKPNTKVMSDKDRIASTKRPELDPKELRKSLASPPPGAPGMSGPRTPAAPPAMAQNQPPMQQQQQQPEQQTQRPQFQTNQNAQLQTPARPNSRDVFSKYAGSMTPGSAIQQATQAAAANRGGGGQQGDFGLGTGAHGRPQGSLEILSDTMGVDFAPYLERLRLEIYKHWYEVLPESVFPPTYKKGKLMIEFVIVNNGGVADMKLVTPSGDVALDRAAWGGITGSNPFPPLPPEFTQAGGKFLSLRCTFMYNLDERDLQ
jgi:TonB family protein